jgi:hypothetical protein
MDTPNGTPRISAQDILEHISANRAAIEIVVEREAKNTRAIFQDIAHALGQVENRLAELQAARAPAEPVEEPDDDKCPKCESDIWINPPGTKSATSGKALPLKKCKNVECDWREWPQRKGGKAK